MLTARTAALDPVHESTVREDPGWINPVIGAQAGGTAKFNAIHS